MNDTDATVYNMPAVHTADTGWTVVPTAEADAERDRVVEFIHRMPVWGSSLVDEVKGWLIRELTANAHRNVR